MLRLALAVTLFAPALFAQTIQTTITTSNLTQTLAKQPPIHFERSSGAADPNSALITVDDADRSQTIDGFGASLTDGASWLLQTKLTPAARDAIMTRLFSPTRGIGLSFLRQPLGSTDLSRHHFSFDDSAEPDPVLTHFSIAPDQSYTFPTVRQALALNPAITVMATPWSAPAWMKTSGSMDGGGLLPSALPTFAAYLTRSVSAFRGAGIPVKYLSIANEPLHETKDFPGMHILADQAAQLIAELGPDLRRAGLSTQILAYDHNWDHPEYPLSILSDPHAAPFVAGSAMHCYGGNVDAQTAIHDRYPDKGVWLTECSGGTWDREPPLIKTARLVIESTRNWARAVVLWGMVLDTEHNPHDGGCGTCRPVIELDLRQTPPTVTYTGDFFGLAHASAFVRPGATRVSSTSFGRDSLETVAFQNVDSSRALLILNNALAPAAFTVQWHGLRAHGTLPPSSLATLTW